MTPELDLDLSKIAAAAEDLQEENFRFRRFVKDRIGGRRLDKLVKEIHAEVAAKIDCTQCGNCCRKSSPTLSKQDVGRMATAMGLATKAFSESFLAVDEDGDTVFNAKPCPLLDGKRCSQYEGRPEACRSYPHLHKSGFGGRTLFVMGNFGVCPIVFNVVQRLKGALGW
jgi:Fe-S-cluster containining protein